MHTQTHREQELDKVDTFGGPYQRHATVQNTHATVSEPGNQTGNASVKIAELDHLTWLSVMMAVNLPDLN